MFEQCRYKYKLKYIDRVPEEIPTTVELFLGDLVHRTLEKLYIDLRYQKLSSLDEVLGHFNEIWQKEWTDEILIVKKDYTAENYRSMGEKYITDFYERHKPFEQMKILGLETQDKIQLPDGSSYHVRIDKLGCEDSSYFVCDYKTNMRLMTQEETDADRQLAMYSMWVKERFPDAKDVTLLWHMLAFDIDVISTRTPEQLGRLQRATVDLIDEIESCADFPTNVTALCNYCGYRETCASFKHQASLEEKPVQEFKEDDGVRLVDELAQLQSKEKAIKKRIKEIKGDLVSFSGQQSIDTVYGSNMKASVKPTVKVVLPKDKTELMNCLKEKGLYEEFTMLNHFRLQSRVLKGEIDEDISEMVEQEKGHRVGLSKRRDVEE